MEHVPWIVLLILNFAFVALTPFAAVSAAAWTLATLVDRALNVRDGGAGTGARRGPAQLMDALVIGCLIIAALGARHLSPVFFGLWVAAQVLTGMYYWRTPVSLTLLNPIYIMQYILFAVYVVLAFVSFWSAFAAIAFAPPALRLRFDTPVRFLMGAAAVVGVALSMDSIVEYVTLGVLVVMVLTSLVIDMSITQRGQWSTAIGAS